MHSHPLPGECVSLPLLVASPLSGEYFPFLFETLAESSLGGLRALLSCTGDSESCWWLCVYEQGLLKGMEGTGALSLHGGPQYQNL